MNKSQFYDKLIINQLFSSVMLNFVGLSPASHQKGLASPLAPPCAPSCILFPPLNRTTPNPQTRTNKLAGRQVSRLVARAQQEGIEQAQERQGAEAAAQSNEASAQEDASRAKAEAAAAAAAAAEGAKAELTAELLAREVNRRRNFAIISHPDAGKTTMTEKLLLFGGAIHQAGEVKARRASKSATSDWMDLEKQRGISISSTALTFEFKDSFINLLDTPGHQDFSEDTYRTLSAADNAVMLVSVQEGRRVHKLILWISSAWHEGRTLPLSCGLQCTFADTLDFPGLACVELVLTSWGAAAQKEYELSDPALQSIIEPDLLEQLHEDLELLEVLGDSLDVEAIHRGEITPLYFGSAMSSFGVELFLQSFIGLSAKPGPMVSRTGMTVPPTSTNFSGLVFKLQANMDARHRDKVAFVRVVSGRFEKGMKVKVARTGRVVTLAAPQRMFANERQTVLEGYSGDVIGLTNPGAFVIGDTLCTGPNVAFPGIPTFSPELFCYMRCAPSQKKAFAKGVEGEVLADCMCSRH
ncbi:P-loop containing nucleoside triphosphate hydrolase protein [Dunaliella salina]|uniref:P-loop containing nucleoside triphosphate hydrolase protein n=1 Tax=Dunaliella salina TaxID=3046 RepID=A0ABQ7G1Q0_DUNSA|nr:P-loop containing nucleoside triphosphate hydrolase protein [Dunaliella salina]|eukprot:KAF5828532.1 P-loop containing nucleoside triphosphate hydrolase protein [Dunaliella salina]